MVGGDPRCCELLLYNRAQLGIADENGWQEIHQVLLHGLEGLGWRGRRVGPTGGQGSGTLLQGSGTLVQGPRAVDAGVLTGDGGGSSMVPTEEGQRCHHRDSKESAWSPGSWNDW